LGRANPNSVAVRPFSGCFLPKQRLPDNTAHGRAVELVLVFVGQRELLDYGGAHVVAGGRGVVLDRLFQRPFILRPLIDVLRLDAAEVRLLDGGRHATPRTRWRAVGC
jgi:hypothetical protein